MRAAGHLCLALPLVLVGCQLAKKDTRDDEVKRIKRDLERLDSDDRRLQRLVQQTCQIPL